MNGVASPGGTIGTGGHSHFSSSFLFFSFLFFSFCTALHERWDEWFFGKQDNDGKMTGYGLRAHLLSHTVEHYPVQVSCSFDKWNLENEEENEEENEATKNQEAEWSQLYDPSYILPALRSIMIVAPVRLVDLFRQGPLHGTASSSTSSHYSHSVVALVVQATTSSCPVLRRHAYDILARTHDLLCAEVPEQLGLLGEMTHPDVFLHREQVSHLFRSWRNSLTLGRGREEEAEEEKEEEEVTKEMSTEMSTKMFTEEEDVHMAEIVAIQKERNTTRVPGVIASFVVESIRVLQRPGHPLYLQINRFLMSRIALDLEDVPMWYQCFNSGTMTGGSGGRSSNAKSNGNHTSDHVSMSQHAMAKTMQGQEGSAGTNGGTNYGGGKSGGNYNTSKGRDRGNPERLWILRVLASGLSSQNDTPLCARRHVMGAMISFHASPLANVSDRPSQEHVLRVLRKAVHIPSLARLMSTSGVVPWLQRLPSGVGRLDGNGGGGGGGGSGDGGGGSGGVEWWSWELLSVALDMLECLLALTEHRAEHRAEEEEDDDEEESLNVHRMRLSSLSHACVHLFRKSMHACPTDTKHAKAAASSMSLLSSMLWRIYTSSKSVQLEYEAVRKKKQQEGGASAAAAAATAATTMLAKQERTGFDHPAVYMGLDVGTIQFMLDHQCACAVDLMTTLRCPTSSQHAFHQFVASNKEPRTSAAENEAVVQAWRKTVLACIACMEHQAHAMVQRRTLYVCTKSRVVLKKNASYNNGLTQEKIAEWSLTVQRFFEWCTKSMVKSDVLWTVFNALPSQHGPLFSLHHASMTLRDARAVGCIGTLLHVKVGVGSVEVTSLKRKNKSKKKTRKKAKKAKQK